MIAASSRRKNGLTHGDTESDCVTGGGNELRHETQYALEQAGFEAERVHVFRLMENPAQLAEYQFLVIPGGFSYGDDVAAGKILANQMLHHLAEPLNEFHRRRQARARHLQRVPGADQGGLLPGAGSTPTGQPRRDAGVERLGQFEDRWVHLRADSDTCVFLPKGEIVALPIAHGEGKFVPRERRRAAATARRRPDRPAIRQRRRRDGPALPDNPNGSIDDIAGICDPTGRVMGLMPHPERFVEITHHPQWTRKKPGPWDGCILFQRAFEYLS